MHLRLGSCLPVADWLQGHESHELCIKELLESRCSQSESIHDHFAICKTLILCSSTHTHLTVHIMRLCMTTSSIACTTITFRESKKTHEQPSHLPFTSRCEDRHSSAADSGPFLATSCRSQSDRPRGVWICQLGCQQTDPALQMNPDNRH